MFDFPTRGRLNTTRRGGRVLGVGCWVLGPNTQHPTPNTLLPDELPSGSRAMDRMFLDPGVSGPGGAVAAARVGGGAAGAPFRRPAARRLRLLAGGAGAGNPGR